MIWITKVLIGRSSSSLDKPFLYASKYEERPVPLTRVIIDFGGSKDIIGLVQEEPELYDGENEDYEKEFGFKISFIKKFLDSRPIINKNLETLAYQMADYYLCPLISIYQAMLPTSLKPKDSSLKQIKELFITKAKANEDIDISILNSNQLKLFEKIKANKDGLKITAAIKNKSYDYLLQNKCIIEYKEKVNRIKEVPIKQIEINLNAEQTNAIDNILNTDKEVSLLEGVTGSGKTIVYLELTKKLLSQNKGSIILVPEIALTDQTASIFKGAFNDKVSILHSSLTTANKYDEYIRIANGESMIVVGTRSAIFAPVKNLSLIVIDEEQSNSYKQDTTPYYDARTVAKMRGMIENAKVVFSSATPLIEDKARAERNVYNKVLLEHKYSSTPIVNAQFIDMSDVRNLSKESTLISLPLQHKIEETLNRKEQIILFINKRGYAPLVQCKKCWKNYNCPNCNTPMVYHSKDKQLYCHRCELRKKYIDLECLNCGNKSFDLLGYGTEKIQQQLLKLFPQATSIILDRDSTSDNNRRKIIAGFNSGDYDILIGTEMVVKGHDFPNVTLVAALSADQSLAYPSYLANELTFDLISQLIGRSGRASKKGEALIQTYNVFNKTLLYASMQDYENFYEYELENRRKYIYPPFVSIASILVSGTNEKRVLELTYQIKSYLTAEFRNKKVNIYGPSTPTLGTINNIHYRKIMLKYKLINDVKETLNQIKKIFLTGNSGIEISIDIDSRDD